MNPRADYISEWVHHEFVEDCSYESPPGAARRKQPGLKAKLAEEQLSGQAAGGPLGMVTNGTTLTVWPASDPGIELLTGGKLRLANSGGYVIRSRTKSRFGIWTVTADKVRDDDDGPS